MFISSNTLSPHLTHTTGLEEGLNNYDQTKETIIVIDNAIF